MAEVEKKLEAIETLRGSIKSWIKELYPHITHRMDTLDDLERQLESIVETMTTKGEELSFKELNTLVRDLCHQVPSEVDSWEKLEAKIGKDLPLLQK